MRAAARLAFCCGGVYAYLFDALAVYDGGCVLGMGHGLDLGSAGRILAS